MNRKPESHMLFGEPVEAVEAQALVPASTYDHLIPTGDRRTASTLREALSEQLCADDRHALYIITNRLIEMAASSPSEIAAVRAAELIFRLSGELRERKELSVETGGAPTQINIVQSPDMTGLRMTKELEDEY